MFSAKDFSRIEWSEFEPLMAWALHCDLQEDTKYCNNVTRSKHTQISLHPVYLTIFGSVLGCLLPSSIA